MIDTSKYIGMPYKELGRTKKGCDCYGLAYIMYKEIKDITLPTHEEAATSRKIVQRIIEDGKYDWIEVDKPQELDLVTFKIMGFVSHIGILIDKDKKHFIHSWVKINTCIERLNSLHWGHRIDGFFRHKSLCS